MSLFARADFHTAMYMEHLRNQGFKRYPENPFLEVYKMRDNLYSLLGRSPGGSRGSDAWMHLLIGPEKAMLIDTGFGIGDLKALVDRLTGGMPVIVVNTHFHGDHTLGNSYFEKAYIHEYDADMLRRPVTPESRSRFIRAKDDPEYTFSEEDMAPIRPYDIIAVPDGYTFDLGQNYIIELIHIPGHTPGGCVYLDKQSRILFSGDAILPTPIIITGPRGDGPYSEFGTVTALSNALPKLKAKMDQFDVLYAGHSILEYTNMAVVGMMKACRDILRDPNDYLEAGDNGHGTPGYLMDEGATGIIYSMEKI